MYCNVACRAPGIVGQLSKDVMAPNEPPSTYNDTLYTCMACPNCGGVTVIPDAEQATFAFTSVLLISFGSSSHVFQCHTIARCSHWAKKPLSTTMLATSKNVPFPGHKHLLTTSADDPSLAGAWAIIKVSGHQHRG